MGGGGGGGSILKCTLKYNSMEQGFLHFISYLFLTFTVKIGVTEYTFSGKSFVSALDYVIKTESQILVCCKLK